jgi:hypothetical protein
VGSESLVLLTQQLRIDWPRELDRLLLRVHPLHNEFFGASTRRCVSSPTSSVSQ